MTALGNVPGRRVYGADADGGRVETVERATGPAAAYGDAGNDRTVTRHMPDDANAPFSGAVREVQSSDGRLVTTAHNLGVLDHCSSARQWGGSLSLVTTNAYDESRL